MGGDGGDESFFGYITFDAYYLALKIPGSEARLQILKPMYDEAWDMAADEDREKASMFITPRPMYI